MQREMCLLKYSFCPFWLCVVFVLMLFSLFNATCGAINTSVEVRKHDDRLLFLQSLKDFSANYKHNIKKRNKTLCTKNLKLLIDVNKNQQRLNIKS